MGTPSTFATATIGTYRTDLLGIVLRLEIRRRQHRFAAAFTVRPTSPQNCLFWLGSKLELKLT